MTNCEIQVLPVPLGPVTMAVSAGSSSVSGSSTLERWVTSASRCSTSRGTQPARRTRASRIIVGGVRILSRNIKYWPGNFRETLGCPGATTARGCRHGVWLFDMPHFRKRISTWGPRIRSSRSVSAESVYGTFVLPVEAVALASHNILVGAVRTAATVLATANLLDDNGAIAALVDVDDFFASVG